MLHRPHSIAPSKESVRVILAYKSYVSDPNVSHIGLGVSAVNNQQVLRRNGIHAEVWGVSSAADLDAKLVAAHRGSVDADQVRISHVVVSAPWLKTPELTALLSRFTDIDFAVISHSNIGFLVVEPGAISLITEGISLQQAWHNFKLGANSEKFCDWMVRAYGNKPAYLPNLYNLEHTDGTVSRPPWRPGTLRIGSFGAWASTRSFG
jgi:sulfur relay (sulfurtransferase) DsrF/TusC family protein